MTAFCPNCFHSEGYMQGVCRLCGYQTEPRKTRALPEGEWLRGRYLIGRVLGMGGFGVTYLAYDNTYRRRCAVKEYFPAEWSEREIQTKEIIPNQDALSHYEHGMQLFIEEANLLRTLQNEKGIVKVWDFFDLYGTVYMVMEYIEGKTLSKYMKEKGVVFSPGEAGFMLSEVSEALYGIHRSMLLHRDISPDNIIRQNDGHFKLIDFGSTRAYALDVPNSLSVLVKPGFAPIEQYSKSGKQGPWTDIYSLAATYYYMVTGKKIPGAPERELGKDVVPLRKFVPQLSMQVETAIMRALETDWQKRPKDVREFIRNMESGIATVALKEEPKTIPGVRVTEGSQQTVPRKQNAEVYLVLQYSDQTEHLQEWPFINGKLMIGRNTSENDICLNDRQISGKHCVVWFNAGDGEFYVTDSSRNGTYTSKGKLKNGQSVRLRRNEWFYLQTGERRYIFYLEVI